MRILGFNHNKCNKETYALLPPSDPQEIINQKFYNHVVFVKTLGEINSSSPSSKRCILAFCSSGWICIKYWQHIARGSIGHKFEIQGLILSDKSPIKSAGYNWSKDRVFYERSTTAPEKNTQDTNQCDDTTDDESSRPAFRNESGCGASIVSVRHDNKGANLTPKQKIIKYVNEHLHNSFPLFGKSELFIYGTTRRQIVVAIIIVCLVISGCVFHVWRLIDELANNHHNNSATIPNNSTNTSHIKQLFDATFND